MPAAAKPAAPAALPCAASRRPISEIYRGEDWAALCRMVDTLVGEIARQQARIAALEARG